MSDGEMTAFDAITFCRKHLVDHFDLILSENPDHCGKVRGTMVPSYSAKDFHASRKAADAYNALAELHSLIIKMEIKGRRK